MNRLAFSLRPEISRRRLRICSLSPVVRRGRVSGDRTDGEGRAGTAGHSFRLFALFDGEPEEYWFHHYRFAGARPRGAGRGDERRGETLPRGASDRSALRADFSRCPARAGARAALVSPSPAGTPSCAFSTGSFSGKDDGRHTLLHQEPFHLYNSGARRIVSGLPHRQACAAGQPCRTDVRHRTSSNDRSRLDGRCEEKRLPAVDRRTVSWSNRPCRSAAREVSSEFHCSIPQGSLLR